METASLLAKIVLFQKTNVIIFMKELISLALSVTLFAKNLSSVVSKRSGNFC